jgi:hypothetical protein
MAKQQTGTDWQSLVVSDARGNFDWTIGNRYSFFVSRNVRATDILMDRVTKLVPSAIFDKDLPLCHVYIGRELSRVEAPEAQPPEVQRGVRNIRTDLDSFSLAEIQALIIINQGYEEARFSHPLFRLPGQSPARHSTAPLSAPARRPAPAAPICRHSFLPHPAHLFPLSKMFHSHGHCRTTFCTNGLATHHQERTP